MAERIDVLLVVAQVPCVRWEFYPLLRGGVGVFFSTTADRIMLLYGLKTLGEPRNIVLDGWPDPHSE